MDEKDDLQVDSEISGNISLPVARTLSIGRHSSLIMELDKVGLGCIIKNPPSTSMSNIVHIHYLSS